MLSIEKYFEHLKNSIPLFMFENEEQPIFGDLVNTVADFNYYLGELKENQHKVDSKKDITIISAQELLKKIQGEQIKEWLKNSPPDELFVIDHTKLGTKIRRAFENTIFRVSIYRDNVLIILNELGYFWLNEEPRYIYPAMQNSPRIRLFPALEEILNELKKLDEVIGMRNRITHKTHLKIQFQLKKDDGDQKILTETSELSSPILRAFERKLGKTKTMDYYIEQIESLYPTIININKKIVDYYRKEYEKKEWNDNLDKLRKKLKVRDK